MKQLYRYKIVIEYLGHGLCGWQRQINALSVQEIIEEAIYKFTNERVILHAAGRTDAGVHAYAQVAHFDIALSFNMNSVVKSLNHFIRPHKVGIISCELVDSGFHARFSAVARHYIYKIVNRASPLILDENRAWWISETLNIEYMQQAANYLLGLNDFSAFRAKHCQAKSPIKTLSKIKLIKDREEIKIYLSAPSFLHHMVRNIVGTLKLVGNGKLEVQNFREILESKDRVKAGPTAPAYGLYFLGADYK